MRRPPSHHGPEHLLTHREGADPAGGRVRHARAADVRPASAGTLGAARPGPAQGRLAGLLGHLGHHPVPGGGIGRMAASVRRPALIWLAPLAFRCSLLPSGAAWSPTATGSPGRRDSGPGLLPRPHCAPASPGVLPGRVACTWSTTRFLASTPARRPRCCGWPASS